MYKFFFILAVLYGSFVNAGTLTQSLEYKNNYGGEKNLYIDTFIDNLYFKKIPLVFSIDISTEVGLNLNQQISVSGTYNLSKEFYVSGVIGDAFTNFKLNQNNTLFYNTVVGYQKNITTKLQADINITYQNAFNKKYDMQAIQCSTDFTYKINNKISLYFSYSHEFSHHSNDLIGPGISLNF